MVPACFSVLGFQMGGAVVVAGVAHAVSGPFGVTESCVALAATSVCCPGAPAVSGQCVLVQSQVHLEGTLSVLCGLLACLLACLLLLACFLALVFENSIVFE